MTDGKYQRVNMNKFTLLLLLGNLQHFYRQKKSVAEINLFLILDKQTARVSFRETLE